MNSKEMSKKRFGRFADRYKLSETHARGFDLDLLLEIAEPQPHWSVLDVATGGGHTAVRFAPHVASVIASDLTPEMLEAAQRLATENALLNVGCRLADAERLPFDNGNFDLVTCRIAPHHFPNIGRFVWEAARVLRPGGYLLVQDHVLPDDTDTADFVDSFEKIRDPSHHRALNLASWRSAFSAAGLTLQCAVQIVKRHLFYDWASRQDNDKATVDRLLGLLKAAPIPARDWMRPAELGTPKASFVNHHVILMGQVGIESG